MSGFLTKSTSIHLFILSLSSDAFLRVYPRYEADLVSINNSLDHLDTDHSDKIYTLEKLLKLAKNLGNAYETADPNLKVKYLNLFFSKIFVDKNGIVSYELK